MRIPQRLFREPITVESYLGNGAYGDQFGDPVTVLGHVTGGATVQSSSEGDDVVSSQRVLLPNPARLAGSSGSINPVELLRPESRVSAGSISSTVSQVNEHRHPGTGALIYVSGVLS